MNSPARDPDFKALRDQLRALRKEHDITFDQLAERSGVDRRTLLAMQNGKTQGSLKSWFRLAQAFGVEPGEFFSVL